MELLANFSSPPLGLSNYDLPKQQHYGRFLPSPSGSRETEPALLPKYNHLIKFETFCPAVASVVPTVVLGLCPAGVSAAALAENRTIQTTDATT